MNSETSMVATGFRLQEWAAQIRECQSRPAGMSVASWCADTASQKRIIITASDECGKPALNTFRKKSLHSR